MPEGRSRRHFKHQRGGASDFNRFRRQIHLWSEGALLAVAARLKRDLTGRAAREVAPGLLQSRMLMGAAAETFVTLAFVRGDGGHGAQEWG